MTNKEKQMRSSLACKIKEVRIAKNLNQYDVSQATGLSQPTISQYEAGNLRLDLFSLIRLAEGLGCTLDYLLGLDVDYSDSLKGRLLKAFSEMPEGKQMMLVNMLELMVRE